MLNRDTQGWGRLAGYFSVKQMAFAEFCLRFPDLFVAVNGAARNQERNYNQ
jgi:hypothetical protein